MKTRRTRSERIIRGIVTASTCVGMILIAGTLITCIVLAVKYTINLIAL
jgi:hypothetical protein